MTRAAKLATLPLGYAGRAALGLGKRVGGKPAEAVAAEMQARAATQLFTVLGELKGGAMKFGQALSIPTGPCSPSCRTAHLPCHRLGSRK